MTDVTTALTLVISGQNADKLNEIRSQHDRAYPRWQPHINFFFPFVPKEEFGDVQDKLRVALKGFGEFDLELTNIGFFKQSKCATLHVKPKDDSKLKQLNDIIRQTLPQVQSKHSEFNPHLTLAQCKKGETDKMVAQLEEWLSDGITVKVTKICILSRSKENKSVPFSVNSEISLE